ncbi:MAG: DUF4082 domain-containing protein [Methylocystis sp.]|uniref:DUF4082 domain-containing protein n=1 Tax=Methylocystis sp. TaxID=1911079 RepID=UPI0039552822
MLKLATGVGAALIALASTSIADPLPANRHAAWANAGIPGGVPARSTICATFSPGATAAQINSAISSCSNGVVYLNAGTYSAASLGGAILLKKSNVTLRGAGANKTILTGGNIVNFGNGNAIALGTPITGATKGATKFTAANTAHLAVGTMIEIDRDDDPALVVVPSPSITRNITQVNVITDVTGSTITVRNPMNYDFSAGNPKIKFYYSGITQRSGLENVKLDHAGFSGAGVQLWYCDSCWIKGVESTTSTGYHIVMLGTVNSELRDSFIHDGGSGPNNSGFNSYGNYQYGANSSAKIENNIFNKDFPAIELNQSSSGFVISYNYSYGTPAQNGSGLVTWTFDDGHAPFNIMNLYEGNVGEMFGADNYYGGSGYGTALRNYFTGFNPNYGVSNEAVWLDRLAYNYSLIGNVVGSANQKPTAYLGCGVSAIYRLGYPNLGNCLKTAWDNYTPTGGYPDAKVASTLLRWGNYDYFTKSTRFVTTEVPSGVAVPADQVVPASYAYTAKPTWWPAATAWPPIGPDVTGGAGDASGHVNKIPAQTCWENANLKAGGAFDAANCYVVAATQPSQLLLAPSITGAFSASGLVGTAFSYAIAATNNPTRYDATTLPNGLALNTGTGAITGTPTTAGTYDVTITATNGRGSGSATLVITIGAAGAAVAGATDSPKSLFSTSDAPATVTVNDPSPVELGVRFTSASEGRIVGMRFYKGPLNTGVHTANLWDASGRLLATATFLGETASGWQTVSFAAPITIAANTIYVVSYHSDGYYSANEGFFESGYANAPLTAPGGGNGVYAYGAGSSFPSSSYNSTNYWVDVLYSHPPYVSQNRRAQHSRQVIKYQPRTVDRKGNATRRGSTGRQ